MPLTVGILRLLWNGAPRRRGSAPQPRVRRACSSVPSAGQRALRSLRTSLRPIRPPGGSQPSIDLLREARSTASRTFRGLHRLNVILSEASLRAKSKDPQLAASSAWVADPSQAQDDTSSGKTRNVRHSPFRRPAAGPLQRLGEAPRPHAGGPRRPLREALRPHAGGPLKAVGGGLRPLRGTAPRHTASVGARQRSYTS